MLERFGPYRLVRRLATGGMAEVFLARQFGIEGFEREVVIKRILPHRARDEEFCTMFLDEARLIARLNHPYIAQVYDLGREEGSYFIAMEYVHGVDLSHLLDSAGEQGTPGLPMAVSLPVVSSLCEALEYIHSRTDELGHPLNIVHRDLNPKNVIISYEGAVKLIDFGIAKAANQVYETRTGVIKGTYGYMAPEQVSRQHAIDSRADLFSLGVLTYELTTGLHPFDAPDEVAVLGKLVRCNYQKPSRKIRNFPKPLERIIVKCMRHGPRERPASARDVLQSVEDFAMERRIPLTMSQIADYVQQNHLIQGQEATQVPPLVENGAHSPARIAEKLSNRANEELGSAATSLLKAPRSPGPTQQIQRGQQPEPPRRERRSGGFQWPWAAWGRRERIVASVATVVAALATISSLFLIFVALQPNSTEDDDSPAEGNGGSGVGSLAGGGSLASSGGSLTTSPESPTPVGAGTTSSAYTASTEPAAAGRQIRVESQPSNAQISVAGEPTGRRTPASVAVPEGQNLVWIRVELEGFEQAERQIDTAAGVAVFTLSPSGASR